MHKKILKAHNLFSFGFVIFFILLLVPTHVLFVQGLPITHDGQDHVARIANFYMGLQDGIVFPRWAANLNWGYGHPILMFLYPLPSYTASLFHFLGFSFTDSLKGVFFISFVLSGLFMYTFLKQLFNRESALLGAFLYCYAPYRFVDLYVRGAIGEHVAFVFPPLVMLSMTKLSKKYTNFWMVLYALSVMLLFLSHNAISIMFLPIFAAYAIYFLYIHKFKKELFLRFLFGLVWGVGLSAFFLIPAFLEGKYTLRDIVTKNEYASRFVEFTRFFYSRWSYGGTGQFSTEIGIVQIIGVVASVIAFIKTKELRQKMLFVIFFATFLLSVFLCLSQSKLLYETFTVLQKFQFPWRFLSVAVFSTALLTAFSLSIVNDSRARFMIFLIAALLGTVFSWDQMQAKGFLKKPDSFYSAIYEGTTDTGESAPIWSVRFMEKRAKQQTEVIEGEAQIEEISRNTTEHVFTVTTVNQARIKENILYFPGWQVFVDGKETQVEFQDARHRGLMTFFVDKGTHAVKVKFTETKLRKASNMTSIASILFVIPVILYGKRILG